MYGWLILKSQSNFPISKASRISLHQRKSQSVTFKLKALTHRFQSLFLIKTWNKSPFTVIWRQRVFFLISSLWSTNFIERHSKQTKNIFIEDRIKLYLNTIFEVIWTVTSMMVTDVGDQRCWWQVWDVCDRFSVLVTDLIHSENRQHNEKSRQQYDSATNISNQSPT